MRPSQKIHVYFMPGMAANSTIFSKISLPELQFEMHFLDWVIPEQGQDLCTYARAMCKKVLHENPVLVGVSFGGLLVQEMAKWIKVQKVIIISSIKKRSELPKRMVFAKYTRIHKLLPTGLVHNVEFLAKYAFGETVTKRLKLYEQYLSIRDKRYLDWAIDQTINWSQKEPMAHTIHIHGAKDAVFPITNITHCILVENGTHTMIIHRFRWFNEHLPTIILES
ncbi:alpha/beta hydrolase [Arenibacter sp. GZD96]|uniref:alpha/beta hydrolase n=1 Tax=Aurantibrevibacter litoralis TaxID=3106030 RepID=UPI002AFF6CA3|nr:alpha/beta hydrolase [Arenibacter sp. GZD-96]MEA1786925.1 alpha/beta hydrolase [Arenibacter sp. GZD-96]